MSVVHVAVGVVLDVRDRVLLSRRADSAHQGGLWEFPGGKVESGESVQQALARELREEIGIDIAGASELQQISHDYGDKQVLLDVYLVREFSGLASGLEGQPVRWVRAGELSNYDFPAANKPIVAMIQRTIDAS